MQGRNEEEDDYEFQIKPKRVKMSKHANAGNLLSNGRATDQKRHSRSRSKGRQGVEEEKVEKEVKPSKKVEKLFQDLIHEYSAKEHTLIGREKEAKTVHDFISENVQARRTGFLYLCGHPGTGKTTLAREVVQDAVGDEAGVLVLNFNAMAYESAELFYASLKAAIDEQLEPSK